MSLVEKNWPPWGWGGQTAVSAAMVVLSEPAGTSSTAATRTLAKPGLQLRLHHRPRLLEGDPLEDLAEEALHDHPLGGRLRDAARSEVEHVLRVDRADGGPVRAADVVVVDLEHRDRGRLCVLRQDEVAVGLVGVGSGCAF